MVIVSMKITLTFAEFKNKSGFQNPTHSLNMGKYPMNPNLKDILQHTLAILLQE
jgi:hypothetical protein